MKRIAVFFLLFLPLAAGCHDTAPSAELESANPIVPPFAGGRPVGQAAAEGAASNEQAGDPMALLRAYRARLDKDPKDIDALVGMGNANYDIGHYDGAVSLFRRALEIDPELVNVRTDLATALHRLGRTQEAALELQRVLVIDYHHETALYNLGLLKIQLLDDPEGGIRMWEQLIDVTKDRALADDLKKRIAAVRNAMPNRTTAP